MPPERRRPDDSTISIQVKKITYEKAVNDIGFIIGGNCSGVSTDIVSGRAPAQRYWRECLLCDLQADQRRRQQSKRAPDQRMQTAVATTRCQHHAINADNQRAPDFKHYGRLHFHLPCGKGRNLHHCGSIYCFGR